MVGLSRFPVSAGVFAVGVLALAMSGGRIRAQLATTYAPIVVDYPLQNSVFPPEFPAPLVMWRDASKATSWIIEAILGDGTSS